MILRHEIYLDSIQIIKRWRKTRHVTQEQAEILRACWQFSKFDNLLISAFNESCCSVDLYTLLHDIKQAGFLSSYELWYTRRAKNVVLYRGCDVQETKAAENLGLSWTLSKEVAGFFAQRNGYDYPVIVTARFASILAWLDTAEHEVIIGDTQEQDCEILSIEPFDETQDPVCINWKKRPVLRPSAISR